jgi:hypothetical protein
MAGAAQKLVRHSVSDGITDSLSTQRYSPAAGLFSSGQMVRSKDHAVTQCRSSEERIDTVVTFTGSRFQLLDSAPKLSGFPVSNCRLMPQAAWQIIDDTPRVPWAAGANCG